MCNYYGNVFKIISIIMFIIMVQRMKAENNEERKKQNLDQNDNHLGKGAVLGS